MNSRLLLFIQIQLLGLIHILHFPMDMVFLVTVRQIQSKKIDSDDSLMLDMGTIEAEASMFGQPIHIRLASVIVGCRLIGQPHFMSTSIDLISALMKVRQNTVLIWQNLFFVRNDFSFYVRSV